MQSIFKAHSNIKNVVSFNLYLIYFFYIEVKLDSIKVGVGTSSSTMKITAEYVAICLATIFGCIHIAALELLTSPHFSDLVILKSEQIN